MIPVVIDRPPKGFAASDLASGVAVGLVACIVLPGYLILLSLQSNGGRLLFDWSSLSLLVITAPAGAAIGIWTARQRVKNRWGVYQQLRAISLAKTRCPTCDYDLRGTEAPRCSECGEAFSGEEWALTGQPLDPQSRSS